MLPSMIHEGLKLNLKFSEKKYHFEPVNFAEWRRLFAFSEKLSTLFSTLVY